MMEKLTGFADYFRKIPAAFLVAIITVLALILFLPEEYAKTVAVDGFRELYRVYLGPAFLLTLSFCVARIYMFFMRSHNQRKVLKAKHESLHKLTPEEKGYLLPFIEEQLNSINVGMDDGVMAGLRSKGITYCATSMGSVLDGFPFNLQPWAREYLEKNPTILNGAVGQPMTPQQKMYSRRW
ncbi:super-infection exclusion protein B [Vibrio vulnificus]